MWIDKGWNIAMTEVSGLMDGVRVVDLSRVLAGPYGAQILAEMGADVIKVEHPRGDPARDIGPHDGDRSLYFSAVNTGKRGIVLDLGDDVGQQGLHALLATTDVVIENFRPDAARTLGCAANSLLERHPQLIVVTVSGYARTSRRADDPAFDLTVQAEAGIMSITGEPGRPPVRAGVPVGDLAAGMWAALGATAGYAARMRDGHGRHIEVPLMDAAVNMLSYVATAAAATGENPSRVGSGHHSVAPYSAYPTNDGWIVVAVIGDKFWLLLCRALGLRRLADRQDLRTTGARGRAREEVDSAIAQKIATFSTRDALEKLATAGVPAAPVNSVLGALDDAYVRSRGIVADVPADPDSYRVVQGPLRNGRPLRAAPRLGEHTHDVMREVLGENTALLHALSGRVGG